MKKVLVIALAGCGVSSGPEVVDPPLPPHASPVAPHGGVATAMPPLAGYRIEALPTPVPGGRSYASKAICAGGVVVATADVTGVNESHAVLYANGQLTDLGTLGGTLSMGADGNAAGTIVGTSATGPSYSAGFVFRNGVMTALSGIGGQFSAAYAINDREEIVGEASISGQGDVDEHAILWEPGCGSPIDLTALNGGRYSWPRDINNQGDIVGGDSTPDMVHSRAVVWRSRVLVELDDNGAPDSQAMAINESGTIAGFIQGLGAAHAVIWRNGTMTDLGTLPGGLYSHAIGIDNAGDVVGDSTVATNDRAYAVLFTGGTIINLNDYVDPTHWWLGQATDVCDDGRIVGNGTLDGDSRGFILTPAP